MPPTRGHLPRDFFYSFAVTTRGTGNDADTALHLVCPEPVQIPLMTSTSASTLGIPCIRGKPASSSSNPVQGAALPALTRPPSVDTGWQQGDLNGTRHLGSRSRHRGCSNPRRDGSPDRPPAHQLHGLGDRPARAAGLGDLRINRRNARTLYPYIWLPAHEISSFEYSVLYAMQAGISILIGGYIIGWLSDKIGRRKALVMSATLAGLFIWPFGFVTNFWGLFFLSIADTFGFAGFLAINVVYMTEMTGPKTRGRLVMGAQALAIFVLYVVLLGLVPHYLIPGNYRPYLFLLAGLNIVVAIGLYFRMPESPRWLEARGRHEQARAVMEKIEARVMKRHPVLPEPDMSPYEVVAEEKTNMFVVFSKRYIFTTIFLLLVMGFGYAGIVYGGASYGFLFLSESRGYSAGFVFALTAWAGAVATVAYILNAIIGDRIECKWTQLVGAILFAGGWFGLYAVHNTPAIVILYIIQNIGIVLWLWSMYTYIPGNYPTRMRSLGTGWTDGVGHLGAWGGVLLCGQLFVAASPLKWILFIAIPGALLPAVMVGIFGVRQRNRALEELTH